MSIEPVGNAFPRDLLNRRERTRTARKHALRRLQAFIAEVTFYRPGDGSGTPIAFDIPRERFLITPPPNFNPTEYPSIGIIPGQGSYESVGLGTFILEETVNKFAPNTAVLIQADYNETFQLELWCTQDAELEAVIAGLELLFFPVEAQAGLRLSLPAYYDRTCTFVINNRQQIDDSHGQNRRKALIEVLLYVDVCRLVGFGQLDVRTLVSLEETDLGEETSSGHSL